MNAKVKWLYVVLAGCCCLLVASSSSDEETTNSEPGSTEPPLEETTQNVPLSEFEMISVDQGQIKGFLDYSTAGKPFYSFLGIPYAKPPIGNLRFKDPDFMGKWDEIRDGTVAPPPCTQVDINSFILNVDSSVLGEEDCLYLNIYTPDPHSKNADLPVLVYFHGGQFISGSASDYQPHELLNTPMILIVLQYRLGVLGFLSTEDLVMPGNLGIKDQTMALKWIHANIESFGGSPLKITLFGSEAGAASVHYQTLTHHSIGLFNRGILQSGTALCPWASGGVHKEVAYHIGKHFECFPEDETTKQEGESEKSEEEKEETENAEQKESQNEDGSKDGEKDEMSAETKNKPEEVDEEIVKGDSEDKEDKEETSEEKEAKNDVKSDKDEHKKDNKEENSEKKEAKDDEKSNKDGEEEEDKKEKKAEELKNEDLLQCLQKVDANKLAKSVELFYMWAYLPVLLGPRMDKRFFADTPEFLLQNARHKRLDLIVGINRDDGSFLTNSAFLSEGRRMALKHHFPLMGPVSLEFSDDDVAPLNMSIKAYDKYSGGLNVDITDAQNLTMLYTDRHFGICSDLAADMHSVNNVRNKKNVYFYELHHRGQRSTGDQFGLNFGHEWVSLGDELFYLFPMNKSGDFVRDDDDTKIRDYMTIMWYFFANTGNPTPNGTFEFQWDPYTRADRQHLKITTSPTMEEDSRKEVREFWATLPTSQNLFLNPDYFTRLFNPSNQTQDQQNQEPKFMKPLKVEL